MTYFQQVHPRAHAAIAGLMTVGSFACGPVAPASDAVSETSGSEVGSVAGETAPPQEPTTGAGEATTSGAGSTTGVDETTTGAGEATDMAEATSDTAMTTGAPDTTGTDDGGTTAAEAPEFLACETLPFCPADETSCPLAAQTNASVAGQTPLGPFAASFAAASLPNVYGSISEVVLVPAYSEGDLCAAPARLVLIVPHSCWAVEPEVTVPAELTVDGATAMATAKLTGFTCDWWAFHCDGCTGHMAFELEIAGEGWAVAGSVDVGCCRSFRDENSI